MRRLLRARLILAPCLLLLLAGCGAEPSRVDFDHHDPVEATVNLAIGVTEGEEPYMFGRISGVTADDEGRIYVADAQAHEVRVFDAGGTHLYSFGTRGEGPGEFSSPCCLAWGPDGQLWVRDGMNNRYNSYTVENDAARFERSLQMAHNSGGLWAPTTFDREGRVIDVGPVGLTVTHPLIVRHHLDADGEPVAEVAVPEAPKDGVDMTTIEISMNGGAGMLFYQRPYGSRNVHTHSPTGDWAHGVTGDYRIYWMDEQGDTLHIITRAFDPLPLTGEEREEGRAQIEGFREQYNLRRSDIPFGVPDYHVPLFDMFFDQMGRLWIQRYTRNGEDNVADVYDRAGELIQVMQ